MNKQELVLEVVIAGLPQPLYYICPPELVPQIEPGSQVSVNLGRSNRQAWVSKTLSLDEATERLKSENPGKEIKLKAINSCESTILPEQMPLFQWMSEYYGAPLAEVIENAVPKKVISKRKPKVEAILQAELQKSLPPALTDIQNKALEKLRAHLGSLNPAESSFRASLLYGVTGSGKTEVYLNLAREVLDAGGSVLVIVPEIALTPQLFDQFQARLAQPISLLHSQVGPTERWRSWEKLLSGEVRVALGARSAVFAPIKDLRLIIVDEEHEASYKQSDGLRYHARDVAVMRAKLSRCGVILGSATPSFESLINVKQKRYQLVELPERVSSRPLPKLEIVDLKRIKRKEMISENLSPALHEAIRETLAEKQQIIILYNRRGFSTYLQCGTCNNVVSCPSCSVSLTYHRGKDRLICHYCSQTLPPLKTCKHCVNENTVVELTEEQLADEDLREAAENHGLLIPRGAGTEKVVDELNALFPEARILRLDRDTTGTKDAYRKILNAMRRGEADILVGTQMIAKGHDLPNVTLVGVVDADVGLHSPDFRSSERTYQLITQAAGRAGRGSIPGRVLVQTREPNHATIVAIQGGRFMAFARYELEHRERLKYPPFSRLLRLIISSPFQQEAFQAATATAEFLRAQLNTAELEALTTELSLLGPSPCPILQIRSRYRFQILIKSKSSRLISQLAARVQEWKAQQKGYKDFRLGVDVDPQEMM